MKQVLFVCTGNTCRSPMAEGLFRLFLAQRGVKDVIASSAGLAAFAGDAVSAFSVETAARYGADIADHRARALTAYALEEADLVVPMTAGHFRALREYVPQHKLFLPAQEIPDPFGGTQEDYARCAEMLWESFDEVLLALRGVFIEPLEREHIEAVAEIEREVFSVPWSRDMLEAELDKADARFFAAVERNADGEAVVGYIGANNVIGEVYITNVAVHPSARRRGIARALVSRLLLVSRTEGAAFVTLEVRRGNTAAKALYACLGFQKVGERRNFYEQPTEDADIMTLVLDEGVEG